MFKGSYYISESTSEFVFVDFYGHYIGEDKQKYLLLISPCTRDDIERKLTEISNIFNNLLDNLDISCKPENRAEVDAVLQKVVNSLKGQITCRVLADVYFYLFDLDFPWTCSSVIPTDFGSIGNELISIIHSLEQNKITEIKLPVQIKPLVELCIQKIKKEIKLKSTELDNFNKLPLDLLKRFSEEQLQGRVSSRIMGDLFKKVNAIIPYARPFLKSSSEFTHIDFYGHHIGPEHQKKILSISPCPRDDIEPKLTKISNIFNNLLDNLDISCKPENRAEVDAVLQKVVNSLKGQITCRVLADVYFYTVDLEGFRLLDWVIRNYFDSTSSDLMRNDLISIINSLEQNKITEVKLPTKIKPLVELCIQKIKEEIKLNNAKLGDFDKLPLNILKRFSQEQLQGKVSARIMGDLFKKEVNTNIPTKKTSFNSFERTFLGRNVLFKDDLISIPVIVLFFTVLRWVSKKQLLIEDNKNKPLLLEDNKDRLGRSF